MAWRKEIMHMTEDRSVDNNAQGNGKNNDLNNIEQNNGQPPGIGQNNNPNTEGACHTVNINYNYSYIIYAVII